MRTMTGAMGLRPLCRLFLPIVPKGLLKFIDLMCCGRASFLKLCDFEGKFEGKSEGWRGEEMTGDDGFFLR